MKVPLYIRYARLSLRARKRIRQMFLSLIYLPIIGNIYHRLYYTQIKRKASHGLVGLEIEGYNVCNLKCIMCPYHIMTRAKTLMNMELFSKIIDDAAASGIKEIGLSIYNEPFLDPFLFERIRYIKKKGMRAHFNSNGTLLDQDKIDALLTSGLDSITFSFDGGTKEAYEKIRVGADFEKTKDNIVGLIKERNRRGLQKPSILITYAAQKDNYHDVKAFRSLWQGLADGVNVSEVDNRRVEGLLPDELKRGNKPRRLYPCRRLFNTMSVMSNGQVALCCMDFDGSIILGDLNKQTIREIYASPKWAQLRQTHFNGEGDKIKLCRDIRCTHIYRDGAYVWWVI